MKSFFIFAFGLALVQVQEAACFEGEAQRSALRALPPFQPGQPGQHQYQQLLQQEDTQAIRKCLPGTVCRKYRSVETAGIIITHSIFFLSLCPIKSQFLLSIWKTIICDLNKAKSVSLVVSKKSWKSLHYVKKSRKSRFVSTISINISTKINLDQKISILKISTEIKWKSISTWWIILTVFKS